MTLTNVVNADLADGEGIATIQDDDFAGDTDTVNVLSGVYTPSTNKLWVKATSDHIPPGSATLTAVATTNGIDTPLGTLLWKANKNAYQKSFKNISTEPDCVTVTSDFGGADQFIVSQTGVCP